MDPEIIAEASALGWTPLEKFKGDPERFIEADEFLERGQTLMPILKANNKRLQEDSAATKRELGEIKSALAEAQTALKDFAEFNAESTKAAYERAVKDLKERRETAIEDGDLRALTAADDALEGLRENAPKPLAKVAETPPPPPAPRLPQAALDWQSANSEWLGVDNTPALKEKNAYAASMAAYIRNMNPDLEGKAFFDKLDEELESRFASKNPTSKVDGGASTPARRSGSKSYAAMDAEAKSACDRFEARMVGANKQYKTQADWRAYYASTYFQE